MSPEYVRPYVKAQKNDDRDAEGIAEAALRPTMRFVELKSQEQLDIARGDVLRHECRVCSKLGRLRCTSAFLGKLSLELHLQGPVEACMSCICESRNRDDFQQILGRRQNAPVCQHKAHPEHQWEMEEVQRV